MVLDWLAGLQVVDWTEGGRTEAAHVKRIFSREHSSGPHQVSALMRRSASALIGVHAALQHMIVIHMGLFVMAYRAILPTAFGSNR